MVSRVNTHPASSTRHPAAGEQGAFSKLFSRLSNALFWLFIALALSIIIEWIGMLWWWPDEGLDHSRSMLQAEINYLDRDFRRSIVTSSPAQFAKDFADASYHYLFEATGFVTFLLWAQRDPAETHSKVQPFFHRMVTPVTQYLLAAMTITQVFSVRVAVLTLAMPAFVLAGLVGVVDGLVMRDLRRWGGGRESSFVYHHAKQSILPLFALAWVVYLALPHSAHPSLIILPFAALFGLSVAVTTATFKKYL